MFKLNKILLLFLLLSSTGYSQVKTNTTTGEPGKSFQPAHDPPLVINRYAAVFSFDMCNNEIAVSDSNAFKTGDTVLLVQMKGALIDTSDTPAYGNVANYKNAGNYEFNYISRKNGNRFTLKNKLTKGYDIPGGVVQLVRVPYYKDALFTGGLTCSKWDGTKGGILAIIVKNGLTCFGEIDVSGMGFKGGDGPDRVVASPSCFENNYSYPANTQVAGLKGESISTLSLSGIKGKGSPAAGGGGGLSHNSGGGGGANAGGGGYGGYQSDTCTNTAFDNRGIGGKNLNYTAAANKIFLGSGGGAGHADNPDPSVLLPSGGAGGGIVIIITDSLLMFTNSILANGADGQYCLAPDCSDGMGGGGGGGTVLLKVNRITDTLTVETSGGNGAHVLSPTSPGGRVGPGGGGGGGAIFMNNSFLPPNVGLLNTGGTNGYIISDFGNPWGATNGSGGLSFFNLTLPFDTILFKKNIDSVRIKDSLITCNSFAFKGLDFTNTDPITSWSWRFGDGNTASGQNTTHLFSTENIFPVTLTETDTKGCKDSITIIVNPKIVLADAGRDTAVCTDKPIMITLHGTGNGTFAWLPALYLTDSTQQNPKATIDTTTTFYLSITKNNCTVSDSVKISVNSLPKLSIFKSNDINCTVPFAHLNASGALRYSWTPASFLNDSNIAQPIANPSSTAKFIVTGTDSRGCSSKDSMIITADLSVGNILLPNSFTPNGDGLNDCFGISYYRNVKDLTFIIYNRFGEKVFETKDAALCWDGSYKGQKAEPANYIYFISAKTLCGNVVRKGSILLIR